MNEEDKNLISLIVSKIFALGHTVDISPVVTNGPIVTVFRVIPKGKTKVSHLEQMSQDFAVTLGVEDVLVRRIPGQTAVGIYIPNKERKQVMWRDLVGKVDSSPKVPLLLGININGDAIVEDLTLCPHLLVAGSTNSGKSTLLNSILATMVYTRTEEEVQFVLNDTKGVEFGQFIGCPHMLFDEPSWNVYQFLEHLDWLTDEMNTRLKKIGGQGAKNIKEYNQKGQSLPYIVLVIDELADLLLDRRKSETESRGPSLGKIVESKLNLLVGRSRASGIHIIASTQRPSVKLVEGNIKANFPARISFRLPSEADSRTIIGSKGAEHLLAQGDMLFLSPNHPTVQRIHAPYAPQSDINACVDVSLKRRDLKNLMR